MEDLEALDRGAVILAHRLRQVPRDRLGEPSVCAGWSVHDLADHVIGGGHRYLLLVRGAAAEELAPTRTQDHVGDDAEASFWHWQRPLAEEFATPGALDRTVHHLAGDRPAGDLLGMRVLELVLHSWDLARSVGLDEDIDADLAEHLLAHRMRLVEDLRAYGAYAPPRPGSGAGPAEELLRRTGRG